MWYLVPSKNIRIYAPCPNGKYTVYIVYPEETDIAEVDVSNNILEFQRTMVSDIEAFEARSQSGGVAFVAAFQYYNPLNPPRTIDAYVPVSGLSKEDISSVYAVDMAGEKTDCSVVYEYSRGSIIGCRLPKPGVWFLLVTGNGFLVGEPLFFRSLSREYLREAMQRVSIWLLPIVHRVRVF